MKGRRLESILVGLPVAYLQSAGSSAGNMRIREYFLDFSAARLSDYSSEVTRPSRQSTDSSLLGISPLRPFGRSYRITDFHPCVKCIFERFYYIFLKGSSVFLQVFQVYFRLFFIYFVIRKEVALSAPLYKGRIQSLPFISELRMCLYSFKYNSSFSCFASKRAALVTHREMKIIVKTHHTITALQNSNLSSMLAILEKAFL